MKRRICSIALIIVLLLSCATVNGAAAPAPAITSAAAFVMDYDTGNVLFAHNDTALRVPASTTKLLTAYLVFEAIERGEITEDTIVPISEHARSVSVNWELTNVPLSTDGTYTVRALMEAMLVVSACGVCVALAELVSGSEAAFVQEMNNTMWELGLEGSFADSYGLSASNQISARSLGLLSQALIERFPQVLEYTKLTAIQFDGVWYSCTNCLLPGCSAEYEGADGLKTGSTSAAGKCLVGTAQRDGQRIIAVLLGAPDNYTRANEMVALLDHGFACLEEGFVLSPSPERPSVPETPPATPAPLPDAADAAQRLYALGLLKGQGTLPDGSPDLALAETLSRAESVVLLLRLLGQESFTSDAVSPFVDVPGWAEPYITTAWEAGLVAGVSTDRFDPDADCDLRSYLTLLYRALGYVEGVDFRWAEALDFAATAGLGGTEGLRPTDTLTRGIAAQLTYAVLGCTLADGSQPLCQLLVDQGCLDGALAAWQGLPVFAGIAADVA